MNRALSIRIPYDETWKGIVTDFFSDCAEMFLPDLFKQMNLDIPPKFLEQELQATIKDKKFKIADKVIEVVLKSGKKKCVIVHIEFEANPRPIIGKRMFRYFRRIYDTYGENITALVIYVGENVPKVNDCYKIEVFGTSLIYRFNTYKVREQNETDLINNPNPFAIVVLANWYIMKSKRDGLEMLTFKEKVYELAKNRNYPKEKATKLLIFVEEIMKLDEVLERKFQEKIYKPVKDSDMAYITDASRGLADTLTKGAFGESYSEVKAQVASERANANAERKAREKEAVEHAKVEAEREKAAVAERTKTIVRLYSISKLSVEAIAEAMELEVKDVRKVLKAKDVL